MIIGGKNRKDVEFLSINDDPPSGECKSFAEAPFVTQHAIGLKDADGKPMVCGGSRNPNQKSCYIYDIVSNSWSQGPSLKRTRVGASATCLDDGTCWVFGGKR